MAVMAPAKMSPEEVRRVIATALDGAFYRAVNPDLADSGLDPVGHYAASGWREGRDPAPWFSTRAYVEAYPEVVRAGWNPLHHYLILGRRAATRRAICRRDRESASADTGSCFTMEAS